MQPSRAEAPVCAIPKRPCLWHHSRIRYRPSVDPFRAHDTCNDSAVRLIPKEETTITAIEQAAKTSGLQGLAQAKIYESHPSCSEELLQWVLTSQKLIKLDTHLLSPECLAQFETQVRTCFESKAELSTSDFKELTGLSRKYLIPLLEWLDASNVTSRKGNNRILRSHKAHDNG